MTLNNKERKAPQGGTRSAITKKCRQFSGGFGLQYNGGKKREGTTKGRHTNAGSKGGTSMSVLECQLVTQRDCKDKGGRGGVEGKFWGGPRWRTNDLRPVGGCPV